MNNISPNELRQIEINRLNERLDRLENPNKWVKIDKEQKEWDKVSLNDKFKLAYQDAIAELIPDDVELDE